MAALHKKSAKQKRQSGKLIEAARYVAAGGGQIVEDAENDAKVLGIKIEGLVQATFGDFEWVDDDGNFLMLEESVSTFEAYLLAQTCWQTEVIFVQGMKKPFTLHKHISLTDIIAAIDLANIEDKQESAAIIVRMANEAKKYLNEDS